jgi:hypothetical protein
LVLLVVLLLLRRHIPVTAAHGQHSYKKRRKLPSLFCAAVAHDGDIIHTPRKGSSRC